MGEKETQGLITGHMNPRTTDNCPERTTAATIAHFPGRRPPSSKRLLILGNSKIWQLPRPDSRQIANKLRFTALRNLWKYMQHRRSGLFSRRIRQKIWWCSISEQIGECTEMERLSYREQNVIFWVILWFQDWCTTARKHFEKLGINICSASWSSRKVLFLFSLRSVGSPL